MKSERDSRKVADPALARRFIDTYMDFLSTLVSNEEKQECATVEWLVISRKRYLDAPGTLAQFRSNHPQADIEMLDSIESLQVQRWVYLKDTATYSVWLDAQCESAYGVLGLTDCLRDLVPGGSGCALQTGLMALAGRWTTDGLFAQPVWLGPGYRRDFNVAYQRLKMAGYFSLGPAKELSQ